MGMVKRDLHKREKQLEEKFPLETPQGVQALLENIHYLRANRFINGDFDASILLIDFIDAYNNAKLTERQKLMLHGVYEQDLTLKEVAKLHNIHFTTVDEHIQTAIQKISNAYAKGAK